MSLEDLKIEGSDIALHGVVAAPDKLTGTAQENKEIFDRLIRECAAERFNGLIDRFLGQNESGTAVIQSDRVKFIRISETGEMEISYDGDSWITVLGSGGAYTLPAATADTLGGIRIGEGLAIDENGVLSVTAAVTEELPDGDGVSY